MAKLLKTLKDCFQPKDQKPDNRPDCKQLLQKINEFSIEISLVIRDTSIYENFKIILEKENNHFLKKLLVYKTNKNIFSNITMNGMIVFSKFYQLLNLSNPSSTQL